MASGLRVTGKAATRAVAGGLRQRPPCDAEQALSQNRQGSWLSSDAGAGAANLLGPRPQTEASVSCC